MALATACVRDATPSLRRADDRMLFTVASEMDRIPEISHEVLPLATHTRHSRSRGLNAGLGAAIPAAGCAVRAAKPLHLAQRDDRLRRRPVHQRPHVLVEVGGQQRGQRPDLAVERGELGRRKVGAEMRSVF